MIVYLSGPMTGYKDLNYPLFNRVASLLRNNYHVVHNPAEWEHLPETDDPQENWNQYLARDIPYIWVSDAIVLLPDWKRSKGAKVEAYIAKAFGKETYTWDPSKRDVVKIHIDDEWLQIDKPTIIGELTNGQVN